MYVNRISVFIKLIELLRISPFYKQSEVILIFVIVN